MAGKSDAYEALVLNRAFKGAAVATLAAGPWIALIAASRGYGNAIRNAAVALLDTVIPSTPNGRMYRVTTAGTTGATEPVWPTAAGATVADGTAVWTEMTPDFEANTNLTEVAGGGYARKATATTDWTVSGSGATPTQVTNATAQAFPAPTANWGLVAFVLIYDAATAGNQLYMAAMTNPRQINNGDGAPSLAISALQFSED